MALLKLSVLLAVMAVAVDATPKRRDPSKPYQYGLAVQFLDIIARDSVQNMSAVAEHLAPLVSADFAMAGLPSSLVVDGTSPSDAIFVLFFIDPVVEFEITVVDWAIRKNGKHGRKLTLEGFGKGLTTAGLVYKQEYRFAFYFNRHNKIVRFEEFLDSFATACFLGRIPADVCAANGLQGRA
eukprot:gene21639-33302_t